MSVVKNRAALDDDATNLSSTANRTRLLFGEGDHNLRKTRYRSCLALIKCNQYQFKITTLPCLPVSFQCFHKGEDVEIDATDEDLPPNWVKLQRQNGSVYYSNMNTGSTRFNAPRERNALSESTRATASPRRQKELGNLFQVRENCSKSSVGTSL